MNKIGIYNETDEDIPYLETAKKVINGAIKIEKLSNIECNIIFVDDSYIRMLNSTYRHIDRVTDVITFALEDDKTCILPNNYRVLGDIYISIDKAKKQAIEYQHSLEREVCFLAVHGFYHLLGYDHATEEEERIMFSKQEEVLAKYGINR